jgi:uncharacterized oxidoreductase
MQLSNRTVLITGGTSGIGLGLAQVFQEFDSKVIVCGRDPVKLEQVKAKPPKFEVIACDVGNPAGRKELAEEVLQRFPDLDILINNAGIQRYIDLKKGYDELKSGEDEININFVAPVELTSLFIGHLLAKPAAAIINISSGLAFNPRLNTPIYNATKAAIHTYTVVLRQQLQNTSVKVFELVPPNVNTNLNSAGRKAINYQSKGINLDQYIPTVISALQNDAETVFYGEYSKYMTLPRGEIETQRFK